MKEMIKRADGSYSERGIWDNIRANAGSGKKPTPEMLKQEKKIKLRVKGENQEPNQKPKKTSGMYDYKNIHTGSNATNPGIIKAQEDKKKRDDNAAEFKKRSDALRANAIKKAQSNKM